MPVNNRCPTCGDNYQAESADEEFCSEQCARDWDDMHNPMDPGRIEEESHSDADPGL